MVKDYRLVRGDEWKTLGEKIAEYDDPQQLWINLGGDRCLYRILSIDDKERLTERPVRGFRMEEVRNGSIKYAISVIFA